jgi:aminoglycoside/choline kinase family phosphotransferase
MVSICTIKVQLPIAGDMSKALVYNEDRTINFLWPVEDIQDIMYGRPKAYFSSTIDQDGQVTIESEIKELDW